MSNCNHSAAKWVSTRGYTGSETSGHREGWDPRATGNIVYKYECMCGATRYVLINGTYRDEGRWLARRVIEVACGRNES